MSDVYDGYTKIKTPEGTILKVGYKGAPPSQADLQDVINQYDTLPGAQKSFATGADKPDPNDPFVGPRLAPQEPLTAQQPNTPQFFKNVGRNAKQIISDVGGYGSNLLNTAVQSAGIDEADLPGNASRVAQPIKTFVKANAAIAPRAAKIQSIIARMHQIADRGTPEAAQEYAGHVAQLKAMGVPASAYGATTPQQDSAATVDLAKQAGNFAYNNPIDAGMIALGGLGETAEGIGSAARIAEAMNAGSKAGEVAKIADTVARLSHGAATGGASEILRAARGGTAAEEAAFAASVSRALEPPTSLPESPATAGLQAAKASKPIIPPPAETAASPLQALATAEAAIPRQGETEQSAIAPPQPAETPAANRAIARMASKATGKPVQATNTAEANITPPIAKPVPPVIPAAKPTPKDYKNYPIETDPKNINQLTWYHGTGSPGMKAEGIDATRGDPENLLMGNGFYLTTNPDIAAGYAEARSKRGGVPTVYQAKVNLPGGPESIINADKPLPDTVKSLLREYSDTFKEHRDGYNDNLTKVLSDPEATFAQAIKALKADTSEYSIDNQIPKSELIETFQDLAHDLRKAGYDAITHAGGARTGHTPHQAMVLLDPNDMMSSPGIGRAGQIASMEALSGGVEQARSLPASRLTPTEGNIATQGLSHIEQQITGATTTPQEADDTLTRLSENAGKLAEPGPVTTAPESAGSGAGGNGVPDTAEVQPAAKQTASRRRVSAKSAVTTAQSETGQAAPGSARAESEPALPVIKSHASTKDEGATYKYDSSIVQPQDRPIDYSGKRQEFHKDFEPKPGSGYTANVKELIPGYDDTSTDQMYRGVSAEEFASIKKTRQIKSNGSRNLSDQPGVTVFGTSAYSSGGYARDFAEQGPGARLGKSSYLIETKRPAGGTQKIGTEVEFDKPIPASSIQNVYEVRPSVQNEDGSIGSSLYRKMAPEEYGATAAPTEAPEKAPTSPAQAEKTIKLLLTQNEAFTVQDSLSPELRGKLSTALKSKGVGTVELTSQELGQIKIANIGSKYPNDPDVKSLKAKLSDPSVSANVRAVPGAAPEPKEMASPQHQGSINNTQPVPQNFKVVVNSAGAPTIAPPKPSVLSRIGEWAKNSLLARAMAQVKHGVSPEGLSEAAGRTARLLREFGADESQFNTSRNYRGLPGEKVFDRLTKQQQLDAIDNMERGINTHASPEVQKASELFAQLRDEQTNRLKTLAPGLVKDFKENYVPRVVKNPGKANPTDIYTGNTSVYGSKGFTKGRTYQYAKDTVAAGHELASYNPFTLLKLRGAEMEKAITGTRAWNAMKLDGNLKFYSNSAMAPEGWRPINNKAAEVWESRATTKADGTPGARENIKRGDWYAPDPVATVFENAHSTGFSQQPVYKLLRKATNSMNAMQLGFSGFHATTTGINSSVGKFATGMLQMEDALRVKSLPDAGKAAVTGLKGIIPGVAPAEALNIGGKMRQEFRLPGTQGRPIGESTRAMIAGGGSAASSYDHLIQQAGEMSAADKFKAGIRAKNPVQVGSAAAQFVMEAQMYPLMEQMVPRVKLAAMHDLAQAELARLPDTASADEVRKVMAKAVDSIDNRFGQVNYDNLFANKHFKDSMFLLMRAPGWKLTFREFGGSILDALSTVSRAKAKGRIITPRMAFAMSSFIVPALWGATVYALRGKSPKSVADLYKPEIDDKGTRLSLPTYVNKDLSTLKNSPGQEVINSASPLVTTAKEIITGKDYANRDIVPAKDTSLKRGADYIKYFLGRSFTPISISQSENEKGKPRKTLLQKAGNLAGITIIPRPQPKQKASLYGTIK